jgi:hypothetical protein
MAGQVWHIPSLQRGTFPSPANAAMSLRCTSDFRLVALSWGDFYQFQPLEKPKAETADEELATNQS